MMLLGRIILSFSLDPLFALPTRCLLLQHIVKYCPPVTPMIPTSAMCLLLCLATQVQVQHRVLGHTIASGTGHGRQLLQDYPPRSQDPKPPLPYSAQNVTFTSFDGPSVTLAGTLTTPNTPGPHPAVLLISGGGKSHRDQTFFGHSFFLVLSDQLTRKGIAVLRYDDRGVGESTGDHEAATSFDLADDAIGGLRYLKSRKDNKADAVGLFGFSEGGVIAPIAVSILQDTGRPQWTPDFVILAMPPALPWRKIAGVEVANLNRKAGLDPEQVAAVLEGKDKIAELIAGSDDFEDVRDEIRGVLTELEAFGGIIADLSPNKTTVDGQLARMSSRFFRAVVTVDPRKYFKRVDGPVLVLLGSKDRQVKREVHENATREGFANNPDATVTVVDGMNHFFQTAETGEFAEVGGISETIAPAVLDIVSDWILERLGQQG